MNARFNLAETYKRQKQLEESLRIFEELIEEKTIYEKLSCQYAGDIME